MYIMCSLVQNTTAPNLHSPHLFVWAMQGTIVKTCKYSKSWQFKKGRDSICTDNTTLGIAFTTKESTETNKRDPFVPLQFILACPIYHHVRLMLHLEKEHTSTLYIHVWPGFEVSCIFHSSDTLFIDHAFCWLKYSMIYIFMSHAV